MIHFIISPTDLKRTGKTSGGTAPKEYRSKDPLGELQKPFLERPDANAERALAETPRVFHYGRREFNVIEPEKLDRLYRRESRVTRLIREVWYMKQVYCNRRASIGKDGGRRPEPAPVDWRFMTWRDT